MRSIENRRAAAIAQHAQGASRKAEEPPRLTTEQILLSRYGTALIPLERIRQDYFAEYGRMDKFVAAIASSIIDGFPEIVRLTGSGKGTKFVRLGDFARFLDTAPRPVSLPAGNGVT